MSRKVYRISIMLHALWMLMASSAFADDTSTMRDDADRWVPSIGLALGFTSQKQKGTVSSEFFGFTQFLPFRPYDDNEAYLNLLHVGGTFELETPALDIPLHPRFFIGGEVLNVSSQRRSIAREGDPFTPLDEPESTNFPDTAILGQGSETTSDAHTLQLGATVGISFPLDIGDWQVSIKPAAGYLNQKFDFTGIVSDGDRTGELSAPPPTVVVLLQGSKSLDVHAVGPLLEIEVAATRVKSIAASVFIGGGAYRVLSDRDVSFTASGRSNLNTGQYRAEWTAEIDPWIYRASVGMRIRWLGLSPGWFGTRDRGE